MCENDSLVDAYIRAVMAAGLAKSQGFPPTVEAATDEVIRLLKFQVGHYRGALRELAATVPGARDWLLNNMPPAGQS